MNFLRIRGKFYVSVEGGWLGLSGHRRVFEGFRSGQLLRNLHRARNIRRCFHSAGRLRLNLGRGIEQLILGQ
jgi:hypothetical protein